LFHFLCSQWDAENLSVTSNYRENHFAAVASDQPVLERWPAPKGVELIH
jgi:hypothetical protein